MASNTYASDYLQGWADANVGLYTPPGRNLHLILTHPTSGYGIEIRRLAYDDGYHDHEGARQPRTASRTSASR